MNMYLVWLTDRKPCVPERHAITILRVKMALTVAVLQVTIFVVSAALTITQRLPAPTLGTPSCSIIQ